MSQFPIIKWINVDGRGVPFAYPQHEQLDGSFTETGEKNPLPTKDKDLKAELEQIKAQQKQILERLDNPLDTQLTGSNVEDGLPVLSYLGGIRKYELEYVINAETIEPGAHKTFSVNKGSESYYLIAVTINNPKWSLTGTAAPFSNAQTEAAYFPQAYNVDESYSIGRPFTTLPITVGSHVATMNTLSDALDFGRVDRLTSVLRNNNTEPSTATVRILRVWR